MSFFTNTFDVKNDLNCFVKQNPNWMKEYKVEEKGGLYRTIHCPVANSTAVYDACINVKTGDIYIGDDKGIIFFKHILLIVARPIHTCIKTLWHASIIGPLAYEIFNLLNSSFEFEFIEDQNGLYAHTENYQYSETREPKDSDVRIRYRKEEKEGVVNFIEDINGSFVKERLGTHQYEKASEINKEYSKETDYRNFKIFKEGDIRYQLEGEKFIRDSNGIFVESTRYQKCEEKEGKRYTKQYIGGQWKKFKINLLNSCLDIVRTPLYGLAMTITYIFGVALTLLCCPSMLYRTRARAARLERMLLRIKTRREVDEQCITGWVLHMCFHPAKNLAKDLNTGQKFVSEIQKTKEEEWTIEKNLANYGSNMIGLKSKRVRTKK